MNTDIFETKHFVDKKGNVIGIDILESNKDNWHDRVPDGAIEITRGEAEKIANPPPTYEQLVAEAEARKQALIVEANAAIAPLQDAVDLDMATPEEEALLKERKKYRVMLNRVDTSLGADAVWPTPPASPAR